MKLAVLVLSVAACGGSKSTPVGNGPTTPAASGGPVYAALLAGGTWSFTGETTTTPPTDMGPQTKAATKPLECTGVVDGKRVKVTCTGGIDEGSPTMGMAPMGTFVATDDGLYWSSPTGPAIDLAKVDKQTMLIAHVAAAHDTEIKDKDNPDTGEQYFAKPGDAGAWCFGYGSYGADEAGWSMCMSAEKGIVSATVFQAGATTVETNFTRK